MEKEPLRMHITVFEDLRGGKNIVASQALVDEVKNGVKYIVYDDDDKQYQIMIDDNDNPYLNEDDRPEGGYPVTGGSRPKGRNGY